MHTSEIKQHQMHTTTEIKQHHMHTATEIFHQFVPTWFNQTSHSPNHTLISCIYTPSTKTINKAERHFPNSAVAVPHLSEAAESDLHLLSHTHLALWKLLTPFSCFLCMYHLVPKFHCLLLLTV